MTFLQNNTAKASWQATLHYIIRGAIAMLTETKKIASFAGILF